jgi:ketosteroid isomerase-like protein
VVAWENYEMELEEFIDAGERVLILFRERGQGRRSGVDTEAKLGAVWTVRDGRVSRMQPFRSRRDAYEAAGLKE